MSDKPTKYNKNNKLQNISTPVARPLLTDVRQMILQTRESVARTVDIGLTTLCWHIGQRIRQDVLKQKRADYGERIVSALGRHLELEFGRGFSGKSLHHMIRFAKAFADEQIVSALRRQLTWTHFKTLVYVENPLKRDFYAEMCRKRTMQPARVLDTAPPRHKVRHTNGPIAKLTRTVQPEAIHA